MQAFNDQSARLNENGNLSLGWSGLDDGAAHATYGYAKNDVTYSIPGFLLVSDTQPAMTYLTGDIPNRTLAASTTWKTGSRSLCRRTRRPWRTAAGR